MQKELHPEYHSVKVQCTTCGTQFETNSTVKEITVDVCSNCHPFYTGKMSGNTATGRIERFNKMLDKKNKK